MAIVTYAYKGIYDIRAVNYIDEIREFLSQLFNEYAENFGNKSGLVESSRLGGEGIVGSSVGGEWLGGFQDFVASSQSAKVVEDGHTSLDDCLLVCGFLVSSDRSMDDGLQQSNFNISRSSIPESFNRCNGRFCWSCNLISLSVKVSRFCFAGAASYEPMTGQIGKDSLHC
ncbi:hypothetical protein POM88_031743 [Heracleum sosnowskyi]|uniref:Uncharacterized protein n=1 Tax=Heracleum sosnowskyi TaxID=360622 RepID=A0AAD8I0W7_9APIA|nr:hypothetical protein POM88_031743 [Heracleum sosnowskyi]